MKRNKMKWIIFVVIILLVLICIIAIYLYNIRFIPKENISEIKINLNQFLNMTSFKEEENIEKALEIEKTLIEKSLPLGLFGNYQTIEYNVIYENGKSITRKYKNVYPVHKIFEELIESEEYKKQTYDIYNEKIYDTNNLILYLKEFNDRQVKIIDKEKISKIIKLLREEYLLNNISKYINDNHINNVEVEFDKDITTLSNYILNINSEKVSETLKEIGVYKELIISSDDIEFFTISKGNEKINVKDKKIIQIILDLAQPYSSGESVITCEATTKDENTVYGTFFKNNIPEDIENLFEN